MITTLGGCSKLSNSPAQSVSAFEQASDDIFQTAVQRCLKTRLLLAASESGPDLAAINTLVLSLTRLRKQALAEQKKS